MSTLTDEKLLKRATRPGRNLSILALLASMWAVAMIVAAALPRATALPTVAVPALTFVVLATGYWLLAAAAKRGNTSAVDTVIYIMALQIGATVVTCAWTAAMAGRAVKPGLIEVLIPLLVIGALVRSRNILLELEERGLWDQVFGSAKPSVHLFACGTGLLVVGLIGFNARAIHAGWRAGQEQRQETQHARCFADMVRTEESAFMQAMGALSGSCGAEEVQRALAKVTELEQKAKAIEAAIAGRGPLGSIVGTYGNAVSQWKSAVMLLAQTEPDIERAKSTLARGDKLRDEAARAFDSQYGKKR